MVIDPDALRTFTDGSCYKNPGGLSGCARYRGIPGELAGDAGHCRTPGTRALTLN